MYSIIDDWGEGLTAADRNRLPHRGKGDVYGAG